MAKCKQCSKEVHTIGTKPRVFCSDRCRKAWSRQEQTDRITNGQSKRTGIDSMIKPKPELTAQGNIRVSKPGDTDYVPMCETTKAFIEGRDKQPESGKRGKDIKCFGDLPMDVQASIDRLSVFNGKIDRAIKIKRTEAAIRYQYQFPDRFHSTGAT